MGRENEAHSVSADCEFPARSSRGDCSAGGQLTPDGAQPAPHVSPGCRTPYLRDPGRAPSGIRAPPSSSTARGNCNAYSINSYHEVTLLGAGSSSVDSPTGTDGRL